MNNTVEKWLFVFRKVKWLQYAGKVKNVQAIDVKFSQNLTYQKSLKSVNFWQSYLKKINKKVDVFWDTVYIKLYNLDCNWTTKSSARRC